MSSSLIFKSISIRNFLSFGNYPQTIDFLNRGSVNVLGENLDSAGSNGSGKCLSYNTPINIRVNGITRTITIGELYEMAANQRTNNSKNS